MRNFVSTFVLILCEMHMKWNVVEKLVPDPFLKSHKLAYLRTNTLKFYTVSFYCMSSWGLLQYFETKQQTTCLPHIKVFWKIKRGLELVSVHHVLHGFWRKLFLLLCSVAWPNFIVWLPLFREMLGNTLFPLISATITY